jgi:hypothetical protein
LTNISLYGTITLACQQNTLIKVFGRSFMLKKKFKVLLSLICIILSFILTILCLFFVDDNKIMSNKSVSANIGATSSKMPNEVEVKEVNVSNDTNEVDDNNSNDKNTSDEVVEDEKEEVDEPQVVYDGMTLEELASKLDRSFKNELSGKGYLYASYSLEKDVDPYLAAAISLEETGCNWKCSTLVVTCNNVGGMKGSGCGSYGAFATLDDGIKAFIDNISRNYVAYGLTTADAMNSKYAENSAWSTNVNNYISIIKNT